MLALRSPSRSHTLHGLPLSRVEGGEDGAPGGGCHATRMIQVFGCAGQRGRLAPRVVRYWHRTFRVASRGVTILSGNCYCMCRARP